MAGKLHNRDIAARFERRADLLEIEDGNPFRVREGLHARRRRLRRMPPDLPATARLANNRGDE